MKIALLSNVTVEVLASMLSKEHEVWCPSGYGAWMETSLNPPESMRTFDPDFVCLLLDKSHSTFSESDIEISEKSLSKAFPRAISMVPDLEDIADEVGQFYDERMWKLGAMPWALRGLRAIIDEINRLISTSSNIRKKVLAVDFDNTLWRGVIGEDGVNGIEPFVEFQQTLLSLRRRGVLLVGLSKNNEEDVMPIWSDSRMVLGKSDFVAMRVDWNEKPKNLLAIAKELNLGIDSFVFVDDNPVERMSMRTQCPEVTVPEFPLVCDDLPRFVQRLSRIYFPRLSITDEDRRKTSLYQAEAARREYSRGLSIEDYLKGLHIWADVHPIRDEEIARVVQLSQKSNQFNICTNRYTVEDVLSFISNEGTLLLTVHAGDRFGDQGLVSFVNVRIWDSEAEIVDWVMSCRTMQRRLEYAVSEQLEKMLLSKGIICIHATWRKSQKNEPTRELFETLGYKLVKADETIKTYKRDLTTGCNLVHFVEFKNSEVKNG